MSFKYVSGKIIIKPYRIRIIKEPKKPVCSAQTENAKSVWFSGRKPSFAWELSPSPLPNIFPEPIETFDCITL